MDQKFFALDNPMNRILSETVASCDCTDGCLLDESKKLTFELILEQLESKQYYVIAHTFGVDNCKRKSEHKIAKAIGVTTKMVKTIKDEALQKLRQPQNSNLLRCYLC